MRHVALSDPAAAPLLAGLHGEYRELYGLDVADRELAQVVAHEVAPPTGDLVVVVDRGVTVAGGAFRRLDETTAEVKRMWTAPTHRRRGLARRVLGELEAGAARAGYRRIELTTGPRQPEAVALYFATGYRERPVTDPVHAEVGLRTFVKDLPRG